MPASSERRSAPAKPTSSSARSRRWRRSSGNGASSLAQHIQGHGTLFLRVERVPPYSSDGFGHLGGVGGGGEAGRPVQEADRGGAQLDGFAVLSTIALGGQKRGDVVAGRGHGRDPVPIAPTTSSAHGRPIGLPRVVRFGVSAIGAGGIVGGREAAVIVRLRLPPPRRTRAARRRGRCPRGRSGKRTPVHLVLAAPPILLECSRTRGHAIRLYALARSSRGVASGGEGVSLWVSSR